MVLPGSFAWSLTRGSTGKAFFPVPGFHSAATPESSDAGIQGRANFPKLKRRTSAGDPKETLNTASPTEVPLFRNRVKPDPGFLHLVAWPSCERWAMGQGNLPPARFRVRNGVHKLEEMS